VFHEKSEVPCVVTWMPPDHRYGHLANKVYRRQLYSALFRLIPIFSNRPLTPSYMTVCVRVAFSATDGRLRSDDSARWFPWPCRRQMVAPRPRRSSSSSPHLTQNQNLRWRFEMRYAGVRPSGRRRCPSSACSPPLAPRSSVYITQGCTYARVFFSLNSERSMLS
jgi:hypothetical protein